ncbi:sensor domain-containing protein [Actinoplanes sp. NPDC051861]|uniref:sensor domain-containing protein n=1 Tax=Actinoplanes sp. NPDC051861 TaxID=3155170 RepID=UPI0034203260
MTTTQLDVALTPAPAVRMLSRLGADTRYVLTGFPAGLGALIVCATGAAVGIGLAAVGIGVPIFFAAMMAARGFAAAERERTGLPEHSYRSTASPSLWRRLAEVLLDPQSWRDLAHASLRFIPSTIGFALVVAWWAGVAGGLGWSLYGWALPGDNLPELLGFNDSYSTGVIFYLVVGAAFAVTLPGVVRAAAELEIRFARALLTRRRPPRVAEGA